MRPSVLHALQALLVLMVLGALTAQVAIVVAGVAEVADSRMLTRGVAYAALGVGAIACAEVVLVAIGKLLSMVRRDAIFDERAFRWVDVIAIAGLVAAVLVAALLVHAGEIDDSPGLGGIGLGVAVVGVAFVLLMSVMRGLLRSATVLRRELDEVV